MNKLRKYIKSKPELAISIPTILCFIQFTTDLINAIKSGFIDSNTMTQLLSSANGFETVVLVIVMMVLKDKQK